ncbi:MAG: hypothetical protein ACM3ZE_06055, partial [Myxococcales bacterium]
MKNLGLDVLEAVNLRVIFDPLRPVEGSIAAPLAALVILQRQGIAITRKKHCAECSTRVVHSSQCERWS